MTKNVYIVAAQRTPIANFLGSFKTLNLVDLGTQLLTQTFTKNNIDPKIIDEFILGSVLTAGTGQGPARQISVKSGISVDVPAYGLNMICGSGLKILIDAYCQIQAGLVSTVALVGSESMSNAAFVNKENLRIGSKMGNLSLTDTLINDALTDAFKGIHMGVTAENIVSKFDISREELDEFAVNSHKKAVAAIKAGKFANEILPITVTQRKVQTVFDTDEGPRENADFNALQALRPVFVRENGKVTAGNSSSLNDGAAALIVADEDSVKANALTPLVKVVSIAQSGLDPDYMGLGPVASSLKALKQAQLTLADIDIIEFNEAFAAQSIGVIKSLAQETGLAYEDILSKTNLNGGAIALGHPLGASGARILVTLINLLKANNKRYGLASLCIGGGMGVAVIVENTDYKA